MRKMQTAPDLIPRYEPIPTWGVRSGMSRDAIYRALGRGDLIAIKLGKRTLIDVQAGLAWLASLPRAEIRTGAPAKAA